MAGVLLVWVTDRVAAVGMAMAAGGLLGLLGGRMLVRSRWVALISALWFLGSGALLLLGGPR